MFLRLLLLFTVVPLVELYLLIGIGRQVGPVPTLALVLFTGVLGAWLAKRQGLATLARIQRSMGSGELPTEALLDGLMILLAGAVLLTPGLLTDLAGFVLLTPAGRRPIRAAIRRAFEHRLANRARVVILDPNDDDRGSWR